MLNSFRTYQIAKELYLECERLNLKGEFKNQLHRASLSICLNLAEGSGKRTLKDRKRFYTIALGSLREVQALLDIIENEFLLCIANKLGAHIWKLNQNPGQIT